MMPQVIHPHEVDLLEIVSERSEAGQSWNLLFRKPQILILPGGTSVSLSADSLQGMANLDLPCAYH